MNIQPSVVTVYNFRILDSGYESAPVSTFKATRQAIQEVFGGDPIDATEERVGFEELDAEGRYRRIATGWGELN
jgi:hypothetical protein